MSSFAPGGAELIAALCAKAKLSPGDVVTDVCCGAGEDVSALLALGFDATGFDADERRIAAARELVGDRTRVADAYSLPLDTNSADGVLYCCALSILDAERALCEARRVLKRGGSLMMADLYAPAPKCGELPFKTPAEWLTTLEAAGFSPVWFEDETHELRAFSARLIWEGRCEGSVLCGFEYEELKRSRYCAVAAIRR